MDPEENGQPDEVLEEFDEPKLEKKSIAQLAIDRRSKEHFAKARAKANGRKGEHKVNERQAEFCRLRALGTRVGKSYMIAYRRSDMSNFLACQAAWKLMQLPHVAAYYKELQDAAFNANVLALSEKRAFLADVVRTGVGDVTAKDKLAQSVRYHNGELVELKVPDKIKAIELDAKLAGELKETGMQINLQMNLINERLERAVHELPKDLPEE